MRYALTAITVISVIAQSVDAQTKAITPDLKSIAEGKGAKVPEGVSLRWVKDAKGKSALRVQPTKKEFSEKDEWVVVLARVEFIDGMIEFDALGKSEPPQSNFLGVAFRIADEKTHDAVYFRPFNFRADDAKRKAHAVQYISHPKHPWYDLRKNKPGQYEKPIVPAPDGDSWFHAKIIVQRPKVSVYVNDAKEPTLVVEDLSEQKAGGVGLWVGPGEGGYFSNLKITPAK